MEISVLLDTIKNSNIKKLNTGAFTYMLSQTKDYNEVILLKRKLELLGVNTATYSMLRVYLNFVEDFTESYSIMRFIFKKFQRIDKTIIYQTVIENADTLEQTENLFNEMLNSGLKPSIGTYMVLMQKQANYIDARRIFNQYIISNDWYKERLYGNKPDNIQDVLLILYAKAREHNEILQITTELQTIGLSTNVENNRLHCLNDKTFRICQYKNSLWKNGSAYYLINSVEKFLSDTPPHHDYYNSIRSSIVTIPDRNKIVSDGLKSLYDNQCQVCGEKLDIGNAFYSETHHIKPLHLNGPDISENIINVCPNHHTLFDKGAITINLQNMTVIHINGSIEELKLLKHVILSEFIEFHNTNIFQNTLNMR